MTVNTGAQDKVPTGIPGLDEMVNGGLERDSSNMVIGGCGSGKTIFCMQYLYNGITKYNENGLYITIEENPDRLRKHMSNFGWDLEKLEKEKKLSIMRINPMDVVIITKENYTRVVNEIAEINAKRVVIDSITGIESMIPEDHKKKENALKLCDRLSKSNCTSMMISEAEQSFDAYSRHGIMEFIVDGVIVLYNLQIGNTRQSALEVLKMRGMKHSKNIVPFRIDDGITVFPNEEVFRKNK